MEATNTPDNLISKIDTPSRINSEEIIAGQSLRKYKVLALLAGFTLAFLAAIKIGAVPIDLGDVLAGTASFVKIQVFYNIRLPRVILAALVGCSLAIAGAALQGLLRNPLADPGLIGVSSGAALGAISMIVLGEMLELPSELRPYALPVSAIIGAISVTSLLFVFAQSRRQFAVVTILLVGIAINALAGVGIGIFQYISDDSQLRTLTFWMMGSLGRGTWEMLIPAAFLIGVSSFLIFKSCRELDLIQLGEPEAEFLGVDVQALKRRIILGSAIGVGAAVSLSGMIGFIGLVVPHLVRLGVGVPHKIVVIGSAILGAALLVMADLVARVTIPPAEVPVSIITSAIGAPFFLWLILRERNL